MDSKTYKLHARVTREIEVTEEQMERLCNHICGGTENADIDDIRKAFTEGISSGDWESGYIPFEWIDYDFGQVKEGSELKEYFEQNACNFDDIDLN